MAITNATVLSVITPEGGAWNEDLKHVDISFTMSGTYAQADDSKMLAVPTVIKDARRNGKTVTLVDAMLLQPARKESNHSTIIGANTVAISGSDISFQLTDGDFSTELGNGAIPAQGRPFVMRVSFTEA